MRHVFFENFMQQGCFKMLFTFAADRRGKNLLQFDLNSLTVAG